MFEGLRHARATTRASALRPICCGVFCSRRHVRKGVRTISTCARETRVVAFSDNVGTVIVL
eukprot:5329784-Pyramimonas_sp.AAC.1